MKPIYYTLQSSILEFYLEEEDTLIIPNLSNHIHLNTFFQNQCIFIIFKNPDKQKEENTDSL